MLHSFKHIEGQTTEITIHKPYPGVMDCFTNMTNSVALYFDRNLLLRYANPIALKLFLLPRGAIGKLTAGQLLEKFKSTLTLNQIIHELTITNNVQIQFTALPGLREFTPAFFTIHQETDGQSGPGLILTAELSLSSITSDLKQQKLLSLAAKKSHNSIIYTDAERKVIWVNDAFVENTGYTLNEIQGKVPGDILQGEDTDPETIKWMGKKLRLTKPFECEIKNYRKDGTPIWMRLNIQPVFGVDGSLENFLGIAANITHQKKLESRIEIQRAKEKKKIIQSNIEAQESERNKIGRELHDNINQLLSVSLLYNDILRDQPGTKEYIEKQREILQTAVSEIRALSHKLVTPLFTNNLQEDIQQLVSQFCFPIQTSVSVQVCMDHSLTVTSETHLQLYRIIQEQLTNISKHACASVISICISSSKEAGVQLEISDNGKGADPEILTTGIGLKNIKNRANLIGAQVSIDTAPEKGFTLKVHL